MSVQYKRAPFTGGIPDGLVGAPGLYFNADTDNGLYRIGANNWGLVVGGVKMVDLASTGITVAGDVTGGSWIGNSSTGSVRAGSGGQFYFSGLTNISAPADGALRIGTNAGGAIFDMVVPTNYTLDLRNSAHPHILRGFYSYTDASNYAGWSITPGASAITLAAITAGTGADDIAVAINPAGTGAFTIGSILSLTSAGNLRLGVDLKEGFGVYSAGINVMDVIANNSVAFRVGGSWTNHGANILGFYSSISNTRDAGIARNAAGVLEVNDGNSVGTRKQLYANTVRVDQTTVASLPAAATAGAGAYAFVTDANTTLVLGLGAPVVGGGANKVTVFSDGTNWIVG